MRDLIEAAERAVAGMTGGTWTANDCGYSTDAAGGFIEPAHGIAPDDAGICALRNLAAHPDFFPALAAYKREKAK